MSDAFGPIFSASIKGLAESFVPCPAVCTPSQSWACHSSPGARAAGTGPGASDRPERKWKIDDAGGDDRPHEPEK